MTAQQASSRPSKSAAAVRPPTALASTNAQHMPDAGQTPVPTPPGTPKDAGASSTLVTVTLLRSSAGRYHLVFKHDSDSNTVAVASVGESDIPDGRANVRIDDVVMRVNGVRTVRSSTIAIVPRATRRR